MDFKPHFKVHNLVSVHPKSIILSQMIKLNMIFLVMVSVDRLVKIWLASVPCWISERPFASTWPENILGNLSADTVCSEKWTVFRERSSRKTVIYALEKLWSSRSWSHWFVVVYKYIHWSSMLWNIIKNFKWSSRHIVWKFRFFDWLICTTWYWVVTKQLPWRHLDIGVIPVV